MNRAEDFLVEVGTEELPPKALRALMDAFVAGIEGGLERARLEHGSISGFASPRRLAVLVRSLGAAQEDRVVLQKGPPVSIAFDGEGKPAKAGLAFANKCGVDISALGREKTAAFRAAFAELSKWSDLAGDRFVCGGRVRMERIQVDRGRGREG